MPRRAVVDPQPPEQAPRRQRDGSVVTYHQRILGQLRLFPLGAPRVRVPPHPADGEDTRPKDAGGVCGFA